MRGYVCELCVLYHLYHVVLFWFTVIEIWELYLQLLAQQLEAGAANSEKSCAIALAHTLYLQLSAIDFTLVAGLKADDWGSAWDVLSGYGLSFDLRL